MAPGFYSYWLTAKDPRTDAVIWEGMLLAQEIVEKGERIALKPHRMPNDLIHALSAVPTYVTEWEPVWEEITPKQLPPIESLKKVADEEQTQDSIT